MILMYYAVTGDNNGVRISCIVFLILVWLCFITPLVLHLTRIKSIIQSDSSRGEKFKCIFFMVFSKLLSIARILIYLGYFPALILFNRDKERFEEEFNNKKYYLISATDGGTFILSIFHVIMMYQSLDEFSCFFALTKIEDYQK